MAFLQKLHSDIHSTPFKRPSHYRETKYACSNSFIGDQIPHGYMGRNMPAISVSIGTYYMVHICLQSFLMGTKYAYNHWKLLNGFPTQYGHFQDICKISVISGIFGPHQIRLQTYMVPIVTDIAGIFGTIFTKIARIFSPQWNYYCIYGPSDKS